VEFDDEYVFICSEPHIYVLSRTSKQLEIAYPPTGVGVLQLCNAAYYMHAVDRPASLTCFPPDSDCARPAYVHRADVKGYRSGTSGYRRIMHGHDYRLWLDDSDPDVGYHFTG
jgi:hypothetical protein